MSTEGSRAWSSGRLGDLLPIKYGKSLPDRVRDPRGTVPVFGSSGRVGVHSEALTRRPALIVGRKGSVGSVYLSEVPCWPIDTVYFTEAPTGQNLRYFKYLLDSLRLVQLDKSTAVPGLSRDDYNALTVTIAPPTRQHEIVAEIEKQFSRLDEAAANLQRVKANLKRYQARVLADAFAGRLVPKEAELATRSRRRLETGSELLARITGSCDATRGREGEADQKGEPLPKGWAMSRLGQCFEVVVGATPSRKETSYWNGTIPWVSSGEVQFGRVRDTAECISALGLRHSSTKMNPRGSVLLGMIGQGRTRGQAAILEIDAANNQNCAAIWVSLTPIPPEFVFYWLMYRYEATRREGSGNNQQALNKKLVQAIPLPIPPLAEQHRIVAEVDRRMSIVRELECILDATHLHSDALRRSILALSFSAPSSTEVASLP